MTGKAVISGSTGDVLTIPAPTRPGAFIRVKGLAASCSAASTVTVKSGSNTIGGGYLGATQPLSAWNPNEGVMDCNPGESLVVNNSAGTILGFLVYQVVGA